MPHVFSESEHPFGQCKHFSQVDSFEMPWFVVMNWPHFQNTIILVI